MLQEFGWSKSSFAMIGSLGLTGVATLPVVGRLTDIFGVRKTAAIGIISGPLVFLAFALFNGDIRIYIALYVVH